MKKKKIIALGASLVLMLAMGMTASAGHHGACAGQVIQNSGLCQHRVGHNSGHHLFCYDGRQDCAYWGIDVGGVCDNWEYCHSGAGTVYGQQGASAVPESQAAYMVPGDQAGAVAAGSQAGASDTDSDVYGTGGSYYGGDAVYGYGGHHGEWNCYSGSYGNGCHGSGHHGRGHH